MALYELHLALPSLRFTVCGHNRIKSFVETKLYACSQVSHRELILTQETPLIVQIRITKQGFNCHGHDQAPPMLVGNHFFITWSNRSTVFWPSGVRRHHSPDRIFPGLSCRIIACRSHGIEERISACLCPFWPVAVLNRPAYIY